MVRAGEAIISETGRKCHLVPFYARLLCVVCESTLLGRLGLDLGAPPLEAAVGLGVGLALLTCLVGLDRKRVAMAFILN